METGNHRIYPFKFNERFAWFLTIILVLAGMPVLKTVLAFIVKLCELLVQYGAGR